MKLNNLVFKKKLSLEKEYKNEYDYIIIGSGVSGITAGIELTLANKSFHIFEKRSTNGGCWNDALDTSELQTDKRFYKLYGVDYPSNTSAFPNKQEMLAYFNTAIKYYKLDKHITNNVKVNIKKNAVHNPINNNNIDRKWELKLDILNSNSDNIIYSNHILFCGGRNNVAHYPNVARYPPTNTRRDREYKNKLISIHASDFNTLSKKYDFRNKKILIIGNGASGCDILKYLYNKLELYNTINPNPKTEITMLYKSHKFYIKKKLYGLSCVRLLSNRFLKLVENCSLQLNYILLILVNIVLFKMHLDIPYNKINSSNIVGSTIINDILLNNRNIFSYQNESIQVINNRLKIVIADNTIYNDIDLVVFATGYSTHTPIQFSYLYKYIIPINKHFDIIEQNIAFIGYHLSYNFIEYCRRSVKWYLNINSNNNNYNPSDIELWVNTIKERKNKTNRDFYDLTYELFETNNNSD